ncbi:hypothetical protein LCGC14_2307520 [marine sediment metagenome]|uniref:Uncharacterized protein n=1 Tax=marine sediment metagenome TaxID=412755 RepID=A0A0F9EYX7_9ZZZZ
MSLSDKEVVQKVEIKHGDRLRITDFTLEIILEEQARAEAPIHAEDTLHLEAALTVKDFIRAAELIISNPLLPVETQLRNFRELVGDKLIERTLTPEEEDSLQGYKDACAEEELERIEG